MKIINVGIVGAFQNGKSTLVNSLLGLNIAPTGGFGLKVTTYKTKYIFGKELVVSYIDKDGNVIFSKKNTGTMNLLYPDDTDSIIVECPSPLLQKVNLIDTPGVNANEEDDKTVTDSIVDFDVALVLLRNKSISTIEKNLCKILHNSGIPFFMIINCMDDGNDLWSPISVQNNRIADNIISDLYLSNLYPIKILGRNYICINAIWFWHSIAFNDNSSLFKKQRNQIINYFETVDDKEYISRNDLVMLSQMTVLTRLLTEKSNLLYLHTISVLHRETTRYHQHLQESIMCIINKRDNQIGCQLDRLGEQIDQNNRKIMANERRVKELSIKLKEVNDRKLASTDDYKMGLFSFLVKTAGRCVSNAYHNITKITELRNLEKQNRLLVIENEDNKALIEYIQTIK